MTRTDGNRRTSANEPGAPRPLPRWTDRRDTIGGTPDYSDGDGFYPDPDSEYEARFETASDGGTFDD